MMDTNINSNKVSNYPIKRIALAVSLVTSSLLPGFSFAQATENQDTDPQVPIEASQSENDIELTPEITVDNLDSWAAAENRASELKNEYGDDVWVIKY